MPPANKRPPQDSQDASYWQGKLRKRLAPKAGAGATAPLDFGIDTPASAPASALVASPPAPMLLSSQLRITVPELAKLVDDYHALSERASAQEQRGESLDTATEQEIGRLITELEHRRWPGGAQLDDDNGDVATGEI